MEAPDKLSRQKAIIFVDAYWPVSLPKFNWQGESIVGTVIVDMIEFLIDQNQALAQSAAHWKALYEEERRLKNS